MVKPPKSMRPESVADMSKAGRAQTKAFQDSSFHTYMARKIHLQRQQFGVVLPPPPKPQSPNNSQASFEDEPRHDVLMQSTPGRLSQHRVRFSTDGSGSGRKSERRQASDASSPENSLNKARTSSSSSKKRNAPSVAGLGGLLKRLKRRHGDVAPSAEPTERMTAPSPPSTGASAQSPESSNPSPGSEMALLEENAQPVDASLSMATLAKCNSVEDVEKSHASLSSSACGSDISPSEFSSSRRRLNRQRRQRSSNDGTIADDVRDRPDLFFRGVVVLINGYTEPDAGTLQRMLHRHGGSVEKYETDHVTAVIASELSFAKAEVYRNLTRKPLPVVTPAWIVDSVRAQKLLPHQDYVLGRLRINKYGGTVRSIQRFFASSKAASTQPTELETSVASAASGAQSDASHLENARLSVALASNGEGWSEKFDVESAKRLATKHQVLPAHKSESGEPNADFVIDLTTDDGADGWGSPKDQPKSSGDESRDRGEERNAAASATRTGPLTANLNGHSQTGIPVHTLPIDRHHSGPYRGSEIRSTSLDADAINAVLESTISDDCNEEANPVPSKFLGSLAQTQESAHEDEDDGEVSGDADGNASPLQTIAQRADETPPASPTANMAGRAESVKEKGLPSSRTDDKHINGRVRTVGTDPNFLANFFSKSRLSFIGSFKQRARSSPEKVANNSKQPPTDTQRWVFHVDIDSFFASVILRDYPQYRDMPVVVSHQGNGNQRPTNHSSTSTSECATCNYKAREFGIKKGMFLGRALELCQSAGIKLIVLPYDFAGYEQVNEKVADILFRYAGEFDGRVNQVSCDEGYIELFLPVHDSDAIVNDAESIAQSIRRDVFEATECTASIGAAKNMFLAKLATDSIKPDGCCIVQDYRKLISPLKLRQLPGIGHHLEQKLNECGLSTVQQVWDLGDRASRVLEGILGVATGKKIHNFCRGIDERPVVASERKSIGAECSYGVRFDGEYGPDYMISCLAIEVVKRMNAIGVRGGSKVTLKIKKRRQNAKPPMKFLGHGSCDNFSKSCDVPASATTADAKVISDLCFALYRQLGVPKEDVRGMGIVLTKLTFSAAGASAPSDANRKQPDLRSWLSTRTDKEKAVSDSSLTVVSTSDKGHRPLSPAPTATTESTGQTDNALSNTANGQEAESDCIEVDPGFEVPSLSQIHLSQVEFLTSPMKRWVLSILEAGRVPVVEDSRPLPAPKQRKLIQPTLALLKSHVTAAKRATFAANPKLVKSQKRGAASKAKGPTKRRSKRCYAVDTKLLFEDDVYPLSLFMDENPSADAASRDRVTAFLLVCVNERRLGDLVVLLRSIRNRADRWGDDLVVQPITDRVNDAVEAMEGSRLDVDWI